MFRIYLPHKRTVGTFRQVKFAPSSNNSTSLEVNISPEPTLPVDEPVSIPQAQSSTLSPFDINTSQTHKPGSFSDDIPCIPTSSPHQSPNTSLTHHNVREVLAPEDHQLLSEFYNYNPPELIPQSLEQHHSISSILPDSSNQNISAHPIPRSLKTDMLNQLPNQQKKNSENPLDITMMKKDQLIWPMSQKATMKQ
jgi:hypothetical protein